MVNIIITITAQRIVCFIVSLNRILMEGHETLTELFNSEERSTNALARYARAKKLETEPLFRIAMSMDSGMPLIHLASCKGTVNIVQKFISEGWNVNATHDSANTPLWAAMEFGNASVAKFLIGEGADVKYISKEQMTLMAPALYDGKKQGCVITCIKILLDAGISVNDPVYNKNGCRPIHIAASNNQPKVLKFLIQNGADFNCQDYCGRTAMHIAAVSNYVKILKILINNDADLYIENHEGESALLIAVRNKRRESVEALIKDGHFDVHHESFGGGSAPLYAAAWICDIGMVKLLVELGADPNRSLSKDMRTSVLHSLTIRNVTKTWDEDKKTASARAEIAEYLIEKGAILNHPIKMNPLTSAIKCGFLGLASLFIGLGAPINICCDDTISYIPLFHVVIACNHNIINLFLEFGADFNATNKENISPYHHAIVCHVDVKYLKAFVKFGCPFNQNPSVAYTVVQTSEEAKSFFTCEKHFFKGIAANDLETVKAAVEAGAVINGCSEEIRYPVHFLALHGYNKVLDFLLSKGASPNRLNNERESPLCIAVKKGHFDCCFSLLKHGACYSYNRKRIWKEVCEDKPGQEGRERVLSLLQSVARMFIAARTGSIVVVSQLKNMIDSDVNEYLVHANAIDGKGDNLLATSVRNKHTNIAVEMLKLRTIVTD